MLRGKCLLLIRTIFGIPYNPRGPVSYVLQNYGGPHDWMRGWRYDAYGNLIPLTVVGETLYAAYIFMAILPATPFAFASAVPSEVFMPATQREMR